MKCQTYCDFRQHKTTSCVLMKTNLLLDSTMTICASKFGTQSIPIWVVSKHVPTFLGSLTLCEKQLSLVSFRNNIIIFVCVLIFQASHFNQHFYQGRVGKTLKCAFWEKRNTTMFSLSFEFGQICIFMKKRNIKAFVSGLFAKWWLRTQFCNSVQTNQFNGGSSE